MARTAIVVGAGTSGSIVTRRLVDAGLEVTLIEAGGVDSDPAIHDPSRAGELWHGPNDWDFHTVPQEHAHGRRLHLPRGKVLGGSHSLNAMIWVRGAAEDFDGWEASGATGWGWDQVRPVYERIENDLLPVDTVDPLEPIQQSILDASVQAGLERNLDYNSGDQEGVSVEQVTLRDGQRVNTWIAYVRPILDDPRLTVRTDLEVHSVIVREGRAVGVRCGEGADASELFADEVVLAAGTLGSAPILLRSGIGPRADLEKLGVDVLVDRAEVGANLHDHYLSPVIFTTQKRPVGPPRPGVSVTQTHLFWRSDRQLPVPDTQPIMFSVPMWGELQPHGDDGFSLMAGLIGTRSRGRLALTGPALSDPLHIDPAVLADPADVDALAASVRQCRRIGGEPALVEQWGAHEEYPGSEVADADVEEWVRQSVITYHHQVGTCRMGSDQDAVVDPRLHVRGLEGLWVVDASVMPQITTGNTNAPAAMIGERGAAFIIGA